MQERKQPVVSLTPEPMPAWSAIVELRQYTLRPGMRDTLIDLFDREFVETQEAAGMKVIGQFRDLADPNRFVWLRGFPDMDARGRSLTEFYVDGVAWKAHRDAARATMVDTTNALLLRPARPDSGFRADAAARPPVGATALPDSLAVARIDHFDAPVSPDVIESFERGVLPALRDAGASYIAYFVTEPGANTFPALPVREGVNVLAWFAGLADRRGLERVQAGLAAASCGQAAGAKPPVGTKVLTLSPTARSHLR
ncbi:MAG: NIPSNAP family protein [Alphaproteobacteria bacterium]|nr:NIPSNAP family protein [Alphaproteobacteria bacterium]